jgi:hypothetical protein
LEHLLFLFLLLAVGEGVLLLFFLAMGLEFFFLLLAVGKDFLFLLAVGLEFLFLLFLAVGEEFFLLFLLAVSLELLFLLFEWLPVCKELFLFLTVSLEFLFLLAVGEGVLFFFLAMGEDFLFLLPMHQGVLFFLLTVGEGVLLFLFLALHLGSSVGLPGRSGPVRYPHHGVGDPVGLTLGGVVGMAHRQLGMDSDRTEQAVNRTIACGCLEPMLGGRDVILGGFGRAAPRPVRGLDIGLGGFPPQFHDSCSRVAVTARRAAASSRRTVRGVALGGQEPSGRLRGRRR